MPDHAQPVREHGSAPCRQAAESGGPAVRRIPLGLRHRDPPGAAAGRRAARVLPPPSGVVAKRPGAAGQNDPASVAHPDIPVDSIVAGRQGKLS